MPTLRIVAPSIPINQDTGSSTTVTVASHEGYDGTGKEKEIGQAGDLRYARR